MHKTRKSLAKENIYKKKGSENTNAIVDNIDSHDIIHFKKDVTRICSKTYPEWDIAFKQAVNRVEDFFNSNTEKPPVKDCDEIVIMLCLPWEDKSTIKVKGWKRRLRLSSSMYNIELNLPRIVIPRESKCYWNEQTQKLLVTLKIDFEADSKFE